MRLKYWWIWVKGKPLYLKWFIFFILIRPVAEQFYQLKEVSPLLSPLYWMGALTLLFSIAGIIYSPRIKSKLDNIFNTWAFLIIISTIALYFSEGNVMSYLSMAIKVVLPVFVYYFLRGFIKSKEDFVGLMTTFLLSCIYPLFFLMLGLTSGLGLTTGRYAGLYADVFNNAFYLSFGTIALFYHFFLRKGYTNTLPVGNALLVLMIIIGLTGLWLIKHMATIAVFIGISILTVLVGFQRRREAALLTILLVILFVLFAGDRFYDEVINPRIEYELEVVEGTRDVDQALHGRMSRWTWLLKDFKEAPFYAKMLGYPLTGKYSNHMIGVTPHNDFLRIMFFSGIIGLFLYLLLLYRVVRKIRFMSLPEKYVSYAIVLATVLFSISTVPSFYPGFLNILMMLIAFAALPSERMNFKSEK